MKILIACGGTGGHLFPGLSLYDTLKKRQGAGDLLLVIDKRDISSLIIPQDYRRVYISLIPLRFNFDLQSAIVILKLLKGIFQSAKVLLEFRPDAVVGFGGYASLFIILFACIFRIRTLIHEPNVTPGKANRILAHFVDKITSGFSRTQDYFGSNSFKVKFSGNPLKSNLGRIEKIRACEFLGLHPDRFTILVMGGSQGAHKINTVFLEAINLMEDRSSFQIIHLCGKTDYSFLEKGYARSGIKAKIFSFFPSMEYAYSAADIAISRAGAISITEIAFFGLPTVLIPYPYVGGHQLENARHLSRNNAAVVIEEESLSPEILKEQIRELFNNPALRESLSKNISAFSKPGAEESLVNLVLSM